MYNRRSARLSLSEHRGIEVESPRPQPDQSEVRAFLASGAAWPETRVKVDVIETHGACVYLAGEEALKLKRAVRLPYFDFATLEARRRFCEREIELNRPHAPDIYLGIVPITREPDGTLALGGSGAVVDWVVRMRRFGQDQLLSHVIEAGCCDRALAEALADMANMLHEHADRRPAAGDPMYRVCGGLIAALQSRRHSGKSGILGAFVEGIGHQLRASADIRTHRAVSGFVRRCHGDLHLGNIVLWNGKPVPFDALEFDEGLATIDTLYDLAFLVMDLWRRGARTAANQVLNHYLWRSGDILDVRGLKALPLYLGARAGVRAMVGLDLAALGGECPQDLGAQSAQTLELAAGLLMQPAPRLIAIGGLSGTGKSTVAAALAPEIGAVPGALHLRSDMERKRLAGVEHFERLRATAYRPAVNALVYSRVLARARSALMAGHSVIIDAVSAKPEERAEIEELARDAQVPFEGIWLEAEAGVIKDRVSARKDDASDATIAVVEQQLRYDTGEITWRRVAASGPAAAVIEQSRGVLALAQIV